MHLTRCDNCKTEANELAVTVERDDTFRRIDQPPGPWHLCGFECLERWAKKESQLI